MLLPKTLVVEHIRSVAGADMAERANAELPEKVDLAEHAEVLRSLGADPDSLESQYGGQPPVVG